MNAKVGNDNTGQELLIGKEAMGKNDNENRLVEFSELNEVTINGSMFKHKNIHKETCRSPGIIQTKWNGADRGADHVLVNRRKRYNLEALK